MHVRPVCEWFAHGFVPGPGCRLVCSVLSSRARACRRNRQVPRVPLPDAGRYLHQGDVYRLLRGHYSPFLALTDSCANPVWLSPPSVCSLVRGVCAGCYQALLPPGSSRRYPESLSCDAWASATTVCRLLLPVASSASSAFPNGKWVGLPFPSAKATSQRGTFRRLQPFLDVQASQFACHSGRSYHNTCRAVGGK